MTQSANCLKQLVRTGGFLCIAIALITPVMAQVPPRSEQRYEDLSTFKNKVPFIVDPYVWGYTREFADLFRLPEKWIESDLKGALAVAFRMSRVGNMTCGYSGDENNCWPPLNCQIDLYYDNRIKLPWLREDVDRDFLLQGTSSSSHLVRSDSRIVGRYVPSDPRAPRGIMEGMAVWWSIPPKASGAFWSIVYYDKKF